MREASAALPVDFFAGHCSVCCHCTSVSLLYLLSTQLRRVAGMTVTAPVDRVVLSNMAAARTDTSACGKLKTITFMDTVSHACCGCLAICIQRSCNGRFSNFSSSSIECVSPCVCSPSHPALASRSHCGAPFNDPVQPVMSSYLVGLVVGEFDSVSAVGKNGVLTSIYTPPGQAAKGNFALNTGVRALELFERRFGHKYVGGESHTRHYRVRVGGPAALFALLRCLRRNMNGTATFRLNAAIVESMTQRYPAALLPRPAAGCKCDHIAIASFAAGAMENTGEALQAQQLYRSSLDRDA